MKHVAGDVTLRQATGDDAETILWLEEAAMKDYATALWGAWQQSDTAKTLNTSIHEMVVIGEGVVGCIATRSDDTEFRLLRLYLAPEARNQGIGATVLQQVIQRAMDAELPVRLRVLTNNPAIRFYARHGFNVEQQTPEHFYLVHHCQTTQVKGSGA